MRRNFRPRSYPSGESCCVPQCASSGGSSSPSFHHFPQDQKLRQMWMRKVRLPYLVVTRSMTVCSRHFVTTDVIHRDKRRLREGAVPRLFAWNRFSVPASSDEPSEEAEDEGSLLRGHGNEAEPEPSAVGGACEEMDAQSLVVQKKLQKKLLEATLKQKFGLERFSTSDDQIRFHTGFASYRHLQAFWKGVEPATGEMVRVITTAAPEKAADPPCQPSPGLLLIDELFLFLMFLSLGLKEEDLADRFNVPPTAVGEIIKTWAHFLYALMGAVGIWMSPEKIRATMPSGFGQFSDTQVLVDGVEMRCEMPSSVLYKSHTTLKGLIGVSPHGAVTFVSSLFSGSVSDNELFRQSGIIPLLDKDMAVMVDKGFRIKELVPCRVYSLPFLSEHSQDVARLMMHVEKATRRIRENKLFDTVIPPTIAGCINQLFVVSCLLTNFQNKPRVEARAEEPTVC